MITISNTKLEKAFGIKLKINKTALGVDTASRTGWCFAKVLEKTTVLDFGFLDIKSKNKLYLYNEMIEFFDNIINNPEDTIIIEETFCGFNKNSFRFLSRIGMLVYTIAELKAVKNKYFLLAVTARKNLGLKTNVKKFIVQKAFKEKTGIKLTDDDIIDAIILAINGIME